MKILQLAWSNNSKSDRIYITETGEYMDKFEMAKLLDELDERAQIIPICRALLDKNLKEYFDSLWEDCTDVTGTQKALNVFLN